MWQPRPIFVMAFLLLGMLGQPVLGDDTENLIRLRSLPAERRAQLAEALANFDALPADQKAAIREIDTKLAALPDEETRASYLEVLLRYHLWRRTLPEADLKRLDEAPPDKRVKLVNQLRQAQIARSKQEASKPDWIQVSSINELTLFWTAYHLKVWIELDADQQKEITALPDREERIKRLQAIGRRGKVVEKFQHLRQEFFSEMEKASENREDRNLPATKKATGTAFRKANQPLPQKANPIIRKAELNLLQEHKPAAVDDTHLEQFEEECPGWLRESLEPLPPDAARRRLVFLYRVLFPYPDEIKPSRSRDAGKLKGDKAPGRPDQP